MFNRIFKRSKKKDQFDDVIDEPKERSWFRFAFSWGWKAIVFVLLAYMIYFPIGMWTSDNINVMTDMKIEVQPNESRAVAMTIRLMETQLEHDWVPNNPRLDPSSVLDNTPNFQIGIAKVSAQFAYTMANVVGRTRSSSSMDPDLDKALGRLNYDPDAWFWDPSVSAIGFQSTSENQYEKALESLRLYQGRLREGKAVFDIRPDSLIAVLKLFSNNLGSLAANVEKHINENPNGLTDTMVDDIYYSNKGQLYAYYMILRELGKDFESVIYEKKQTQIWEQMIQGLKTAAEIDPLIVFNGDIDTMFLNSHLTGQGFFLLLSDRRMKEVMDGLLK